MTKLPCSSRTTQLSLLCTFLTLTICLPNGTRGVSADTATATVETIVAPEGQASVDTPMKEEETETCTVPSMDSAEKESTGDENPTDDAKLESPSPADEAFDSESAIEYGTTFGVSQETDSASTDLDQVLVYLQETEAYLQELPEEYSTNCRNLHEMCTVWAVEDFCLDDSKATDPFWMARHCAPACRLCEEFHTVHQAKGPGSNFGVVQSLEQATGEDKEYYNETITLADIERTLEASQQYMDTVVLADSQFDKVRTFCYNYLPQCTVHALQGLCDPDHEDYEWMVEHCSPACQTCHLLHYETRCPIDRSTNIWEAGDLDRMFRRIVEDEQYKTLIWSQPSEVEEEDGPWIITIDNFVTDDEAQVLIQHGTDLGYEASGLASGFDEETGESTGDDYIDDTRTSKNTWCSQACRDDPVVQGVWQKIVDLTGIPQENSEELQLLKYEPGEYYELHHDNAEEWFQNMAGPRILTVFIYLSDVEEGGQTYFDHKELRVNPKKGRVVLWPSVLNEDPEAQEERTYHESMPLMQGRKYAANSWFRLRSRIKADVLDCY